MMGRIVLLVLAALAGQHADAFTPSSFQRRPNIMMRMASPGDDVSIPYDAAARLAYDEWRAQYKKGNFDDDRYASFKANYEAITVANISAKKLARDASEDLPRMLTLNQFGDYTSEEYEAMQPAEEVAEEVVQPDPSDNNILGKAFDAMQSQAGAADALAEAADALDEEEEVSGNFASKILFRL